MGAVRGCNLPDELMYNMVSSAIKAPDPCSSNHGLHEAAHGEVAAHCAEHRDAGRSGFAGRFRDLA
jgi:hypothetical protein